MGNQYTKAREILQQYGRIDERLQESIAKAKIKRKTRSDKGKNHLNAVDRLNRKIRGDAEDRDEVALLLKRIKDIQIASSEAKVGTIPDEERKANSSIRHTLTNRPIDEVEARYKLVANWNAENGGQSGIDEWAIWDKRQAVNEARKQNGLNELFNPIPGDDSFSRDTWEGDNIEVKLKYNRGTLFSGKETDTEISDRISKEFFDKHKCNLETETEEQEIERTKLVDKALADKMKTPEGRWLKKVDRRRMRREVNKILESNRDDFHLIVEAKKKIKQERAQKTKDNYAERKRLNSLKHKAKSAAQRLALIPEDHICSSCKTVKLNSKQWFVNTKEKFVICRACYERNKVLNNAK